MAEDRGMDFEEQQRFIYKVVELKSQGKRNEDVAEALKVPLGRVAVVASALVKKGVLPNTSKRFARKNLLNYIDTHTEELKKHAKQFA